MINRFLSAILICLFGLAGISGCAFKELKKDLKVIEKASLISGSVVHSGAKKTPIIVALGRVDAKTGEFTVVQYLVVYGERRFSFLATQGDYRIIAFEDRNEDLAFQHDEYVGWFGEPTTIKARGGKEIKGIKITLQDPRTARAKLPDLYRRSTQNYRVNMKDFPLGKKVSLEDDRFGPKAGQEGLWTPVRFLRKGYAGIYFLEAYDPKKTPVLFIHGAGGFPREWQFIISRLDRKKFQPWLFYYASGMRIAYSADMISQGLRNLRIKHGFKKVILVAHSMGGLVAREFLNNCKDKFAKVLVTISTPWGGVSAAGMGVEHSPAIVPSWYDVVPGSPFLKTLSSKRPQGRVPFYLFFGYQGESSMFIKGNGDGSVSLRSMLNPRAQAQAVKVLGFDADHTGVLKSEKVARALNQVLSRQ